jgi:SPX domain-containing protein involved in vacuolar polyphosphate accumulation
MAIETFKRYEKKYLLTNDQFDNFRKEISAYMSYDAYCKNGNMYPIYNIYFDNDNNSVVQHSVSKPYFKDKLRIRSYKERPEENDFIFLELKKKIGGIVTKRRTELRLCDCRKYIKTGEYPPEAETDYRMNQVLHEIDYFNDIYHVKPTTYLSYQRLAYFANDNKEFRLTFDKKLVSRRHDLQLELGSYGEELLSDDVTLMEIKIIGAMPMWCSRLLSDLEIFPKGFSKYGHDYKKFVSENKNNNKNNYTMEVV